MPLRAPPGGWSRPNRRIGPSLSGPWRARATSKGPWDLLGAGGPGSSSRRRNSCLEWYTAVSRCRDTFRNSVHIHAPPFGYVRSRTPLYGEVRERCDLIARAHADLSSLSSLGSRSSPRSEHDGVAVDIPPLPHGTILLVEVGSTAHGTGLPGGEDQDETAVVIESPSQVLGLAPGGPATIMQRTQPEGVKSGPGDTDRTLHPLRRFLYLAASGNPSVLMSLWAPVLEATAEGLESAGTGRSLRRAPCHSPLSRVHAVAGCPPAGPRRGPARKEGRRTEGASQ